MKQISLLVIDDNRVSLLLPNIALSGQGVEVFECDNAESGLEILQNKKITHILLDISMPELNGIELAKEIRNSKRYDAIKIIAYTANSAYTSSQDLSQYGFDRVLIKPFKLNELLQILT